MMPQCAITLDFVLSLLSKPTSFFKGGICQRFAKPVWAFAPWDEGSGQELGIQGFDIPQEAAAGVAFDRHFLGFDPHVPG